MKPLSTADDVTLPWEQQLLPLFVLGAHTHGKKHTRRHPARKTNNKNSITVSSEGVFARDIGKWVAEWTFTFTVRVGGPGRGERARKLEYICHSMSSSTCAPCTYAFTLLMYSNVDEFIPVH